MRATRVLKPTERGDRHMPVQMLPNRIHARRKPGTENLLVPLGTKVAVIETPFEPEGGANESHGS